MAVEHFDGIVVGSRGIQNHNARQLNRHGQQAPAIADATTGAITPVDAITGGESPSEAEHNTLVAAHEALVAAHDALAAKVNALLAACRGTGIIASS